MSDPNSVNSIPDNSRQRSHMNTFVVGVGSDFYDAEGAYRLPSLRTYFLELPDDVEIVTVPVPGGPISPRATAGIDALVMSGGSFGAASLADDNRIALVCRWGVGYDTVNLAECAANGVVVTNAPEGVRRSMAHTAIAFVLMLAHRIVDQDRAIRNGNTWATKHQFIGTGLVGKTLGVIGLGNIGREILRVASVFDCDVIGFDPYADAEKCGPVTLVELDELMARSDFIIVQCALTPETRGMISRERLALMKPTAYLVNTARGQIVDEEALIDALTTRQIAGAALDVFAKEPMDDDNPHSAGWTDDFARQTAMSISRSIRSIMDGELPDNCVNRRELAESGVEPRFLRGRSWTTVS
jgi:phosphoglycerate dehydrogenase-like enzyme